MTNLMTSLGNQVIKILPSWCFKETPTNEALKQRLYDQAIQEQNPDDDKQNLSMEALLFWQDNIAKMRDFHYPDTVDTLRFKDWMHFGHLKYDELEELSIAQNNLLNDRDESIKILEKHLFQERTCFDMHWFWVTMYLLGIGTGTMGVLLYQALQSTYNLV